MSQLGRFVVGCGVPLRLVSTRRTCMAPGDSATLNRDPQRPSAAAPPLTNPDLHHSLPTGLALHILALLLRRDAESRGGALVRNVGVGFSSQ